MVGPGWAKSMANMLYSIHQSFKTCIYNKHLRHMVFFIGYGDQNSLAKHHLILKFIKNLRFESDVHVMLCTYQLSGRAGWENIWFEVMTYGSWTARSVHHDQDTNLFLSSPKGHMMIPYLPKLLKTLKLVWKLYGDYLFAMFRTTEESFKKNMRGNINK